MISARGRLVKMSPSSSRSVPKGIQIQQCAPLLTAQVRESAYLEVWAYSTNTKQDVYYRPNGLNIRKCSASVAVILY